VSKTNTIIINGKSYDAETGALLHEKQTIEPRPEHAPKPAANRHVASHATGHKPEHAKTLARRSVAKPGLKTKRKFTASIVVSETPADQLALVEVKSGLSKVDLAKLQHAKHVQQSKLISRFSPDQSSAYTPLTETPPPLLMPAPIMPQADDKPKTTAALLEKAIEHATSHKQTSPKHLSHKTKRKHATKLAIATVTAVALIGAVAAQNLNSLRVQSASSRAGFSAVLPGYKPSGFRLSDIKSTSGVVALNYVSNSNQDVTYSVIEKSTTWDNQALLDNFVKPTGQAYQALPTNGNTYYVYGEHTVTWVSGSVWYQVQSQNALGDQQLLDLAESL